jgi:signal transduction histidine kinase
MVKTQEVSVPLAPRKRERIKNRLSALRSDLSRVSDYFARAQQLITLLVAQDRMNPQVKEAMRRVDWEKVVKNYSNTLEQAHSHFENIVEALNNTKDDENVDTFEESKAPVFLSEIIDEALKKVSRGRDLQINKLYFYNEDLPLYKKEMESVFYNLFLQSIESMDKELPGTLRVVTRPKGRLAEIEISDTGWGIDKEKFFKSEVGESIESVLKRHKGKLNLSSSKGSGSTFVIDLPSH